MMGFAVTVGHSVQKSELKAVIRGNFLLLHSNVFHEPPHFFFVRNYRKRKIFY